MNANEDSLHTLNEIRSLMERSSKFLSLSGLSGVFAGVFALIGAAAAYIRFKTDWLAQISTPLATYSKSSRDDVTSFLLIDGLCVLILSLACGIIMTVRKGTKRGLKVWNGSSKRLLVGMLVPLGAGGVFCLAMLYYGMIWVVFPATLIFYGIALVNASKFTYPELFYLGISEIVLGSITLFLTGYSLLFWALGFGVLHIVYGLTMYNRYDREKITAASKSSAKGLFGILFVLASFACNAQSSSDSTVRQVKRWYDKETIYLQGNGYVKDNVYYRGQKALKNEFAFSQGGFELFKKSRRTRGIATVLSVAGAIGSISSLVSGNRNNVKTFFWVSLGTGFVSTILTVQANNQRDQAVWFRNRDAMLFLEANK
jgi:hypothetical protein